MNHSRESEEALARWADGVLQQLPLRPAPTALAARIRAAVERAAMVPWHRRPWLHWPLGLQILSGVCGAAALALLWSLLLPGADAATASAVERAAGHLEFLAPLKALLTLVGVLWNAALVVLRELNPWVIAGGFGLLALLWSTTLGIGTACWRLAAGGLRQR